MNPKFYAFVTASAGMGGIIELLLSDYPLGCLFLLIAFLSGIACAVAKINVKSIYGEEE